MTDKTEGTATIVVKLSDEDRKLLKGAIAAAAKVGGAAATSNKSSKTAKNSAADDGDEGFDDTDGDGDDSGDDGEGEGDDGDDGEGDDGEGDDGEEALTTADVQTAMRNYANKTNKAKAMAVLKAKGGVDALSKLKAAKFEAVINECKRLTKAAAKK